MSGKSFERRPERLPPSGASLEDVAADWLARREAGFSVDEQADFSRWLLVDPEHARAVERLAMTWRRLQKPRLTGQAEWVECAIEARVAQRATRNRRRVVAGAFAAALAAAAALAVAIFPRQPIVQPQADLAASVVARPERRTLADGSVVELNAGAEIAVNFSVERREVRLVRGEAHFAVTKDPDRPFVVAAGTVAVRAVGTEFAVRFAPSAISVLVTEGRVAVEGTTAKPEVATFAVDPPDVGARSAVTYVDAGNRLTVPAGPAVSSDPIPMSTAEVRAALAWRGMRVEFLDTPLAEAVALFNRQNRTQLELATAEVGAIRISGFFWGDDPDGFSRLLEVSAGLRADRSVPGRIRLVR